MIKMPTDVINILQKLNNNGYDGYVVGGAVRDSLLNKEPKDWDITTNAIPSVVESLFENTIATGKEYGTITALINHEPYEITTYRLESDYDGRRPKAVKFSNNLLDDLSRRDFTINSIAIGLDGILIDPFDGKLDLEHGKIVCVGNAEDRIKEDKLRALRAIRFASRYGFSINRDIIYAIEDIDITTLSQERVTSEFNKILIGGNPRFWIDFLADTGLLVQILPEMNPCFNFWQHNPHHYEDVFNHILSVVEAVEPKLELRLSALFHDISKPQTYTIDENGIGHFYKHHKESAKMCRDIMKRMKYSNKEIDYVSELVYNHMCKHETMKKSAVKKFIVRVGEDKLHDLFKLQLADVSASKPPYDFEKIINLRIECEKILEAKEPMSVKDLAVNGNDMMKIGYVGKEIGVILNELLELVLKIPSDNNKEKLIQLAQIR